MGAQKPKTVVLIAGPTAAGKTGLALSLAQHFQTAVISADSRQCYREMNIGTAKPPAGELKKVLHYFINSHSITEEVNAGLFEKLALEYAGQIFSKNNTAVLCGGTGLYIKAFCEGIDDMPRVPEAIRRRVRDYYVQHGAAGLQQELRLKDPGFFQQAEKQNPHRLMRALEVWEATGKSILTFRKNEKKIRDFNIIKIGLQLPREQLWANIEHRTGNMVRLGLVDEVKQLLPYRRLNALQTVGYREVFDFLDGRCSIDEAVDNINLHTRRYAKRQMTWFRKDRQINWFSPGDQEGILHFIQRETANFA